MNRVLLVATCLLLAVPAATYAQSEPKEAVKYDIFIACPNTTNNQCPVEAWDGADALGSPAIAVDPDNVNNMIFASLHNGHSGSPEERSRPSQPFTTHTSTDHGASWVDNPYSPPTGLPFGTTGEHPGIALDPYGHVFISSLYAVPDEDEDGQPTGDYEYTIAAQKFASLNDIRSNQNGRYNLDYVTSLTPYNRIGQTWFAYDAVSDNVVLLWNEQVTGASKPNATANDSAPADQAMELVHRLLDPDGPDGARAAAPGTNGSGPQSAIGWVWTSADVNDPYHEPPGNGIAPCATSTNPVVSEGWLYVGCQVAPDQGAPEWNPAAQPGETHMFRFLPAGGEPQYIGQVPLSGGQPKLGVRSDGRMALMTTEVGPNGTIRLDGVYGQYDNKTGEVAWGEVHHYGDDLVRLYANMQVRETNIQDMIYREYSGVIHLIFKRVADWPTDAPYGYRPEYFKAVVAIDEHYGLLEEIDLGIGDLGKRQKDGTLYSYPVSLYNDLADDFLELPPEPFEYQNRPLGEFYQREFYAVGNYGFVDFAELIEVTELRGPAAVGLPNPPPPPNPAPATANSLALGLAGSLTASAILAATVATNKRKSHVRAGRKKRT